MLLLLTQVLEEGTIPEHDVVVTNPPFSGEHVPKVLSFCARQGAKPWFLLLPNYVYLKVCKGTHCSPDVFMTSEELLRTTIPPDGTWSGVLTWMSMAYPHYYVVHPTCTTADRRHEILPLQFERVSRFPLIFVTKNLCNPWNVRLRCGNS